MNNYRVMKFSILIYTFKQWNIVRYLINIGKNVFNFSLYI